MCRVENLSNETMVVNGDVLYTELLNSGNTQYCFAFFKIVIPSKTNTLMASW